MTPSTQSGAVIHYAPAFLRMPNLDDYDRFVVFFSGGKDSVCAFLMLLEHGVPLHKIELHHHLVDGRESTLMDWPVTESYCVKFAEAFGVPIYMSWKVGGFEGEMLRNQAPTAAIAFESADGTTKVIGGEGDKLNTRMKFPQLSANLNVRWCSAYLKCDVGDRVLNHEPRFRIGKTLVITGERAEESKARSHYEYFEPHRTHRTGKRVQRYVDHWRPALWLREAEVWARLERFMINPHPAYWLGFGRVSCRNCIFATADQRATVRTHMRHAFIPIQQHETNFNMTIHRTC